MLHNRVLRHASHLARIQTRCNVVKLEIRNRNKEISSWKVTNNEGIIKNFNLFEMKNKE